MEAQNIFDLDKKLSKIEIIHKFDMVVFGTNFKL